MPQYIKPSTPGAYLGGFSSTPLHYPSKGYMRNNHSDLKEQQQLQQQYANMQPGSRKYQAGMVVLNEDQNNNGSPQAH